MHRVSACTSLHRIEQYLKLKKLNHKFSFKISEENNNNVQNFHWKNRVFEQGFFKNDKIFKKKKFQPCTAFDTLIIREVAAHSAKMSSGSLRRRGVRSHIRVEQLGVVFVSLKIFYLKKIENISFIFYSSNFQKGYNFKFKDKFLSLQGCLKNNRFLDQKSKN